MKFFNMEAIFFLITQKSTPFENLFNYALFCLGLKVVQNSSEHNQNQSTVMHPIQKQLDKREKEFPKQKSKNVDNKKIPQTEKKNEN